LWFSGDGDQLLAAEPGDHGATPCGGADVVIGHFPFNFDIILRVSVDPVENLMSTCARPPFCAVMEVGLSGSESSEAAARSCVVKMDDRTDDNSDEV
jgi:hypothetical protein